MSSKLSPEAGRGQLPSSPPDATSADVAGATGVTYTIQLNSRATVAKNRSRT
jgi:hypothetical protein